MDIKELDLVDPHTHWYYQAKLAAIRGGLENAGFRGGDIADVGAGSGFFSLAMVKGQPEHRAFCIDPNYSSSVLGERGQCSFVNELPQELVPRVQTYLFIDVLEHVPDDLDVLKGYVDAAKRTSLFAITVPAFMSLWSGHDVYLEHYRRYRRRQLVGLASQSGLQVLHSQYLFGSTFIPIWIARRLKGTRTSKSDLRQFAAPLNQALRTVLTYEHRVAWNPIFGSSVMVIGRKPA